jgi:DNA anti-recombination protein RmuC
LGEIAKSLSQISQNLDSTEYQSARQLNSIVQTIDKIRLQLLDSDPAD